MITFSRSKTSVDSFVAAEIFFSLVMTKWSEWSNCTCEEQNRTRKCNSSNCLNFNTTETQKCNSSCSGMIIVTIDEN